LNFKKKISYVAIAGLLTAGVLITLALHGDPFFYLHQRIAAPFVRLWIEKQNQTSMNQLGVPISVASLDVMNRVVSDASSKKRFVTSSAFIRSDSLTSDGLTSDDLQSGCQLFVIQNLATQGQTISTRTLQNTDNGVCHQQISGFHFSDDDKHLALELKHALTEAREIILYARSGEKYQLSNRFSGRLVRPRSFTFDHAILFYDTSDMRDRSCVIMQLLDGIRKCTLSKADLPADAPGTAVAMFRARNNGQSWVIVSAYLNDIGKVYQFSSVNGRSRFRDTGIDGVDQLAATHQGFIYADLISSEELKNTKKIQLHLYLPDQGIKNLLSAEETELDWAGYGTGAFVLLRNRSGNKLWIANDTGLEQLPLSSPLQREKKLALNYLHYGMQPRVRIENEAGESSDGWIDAHGDFVELRSKKFPFEIRIEKFLAQSRDGTLVPCTWITKKSSSEAMPGIVRVYGAYGTVLKGEVDELSAAVLENQIGYLLAHVRGGGEQGKFWENAGKAKNKENTIFDTQACIQAGMEKQLIQKGKILLQGSSAGAIPAMLTALRNPDVVAGAWLDTPYLDGSGLHHNLPEDNEEYGDVAKEDEFNNRKKLTPYLQLLTPARTGGRFLLTCGAQDRITPAWHCTKTHAAITRYHPNKVSFLWVSNTTHFIGNPYSVEERDKNKIALQFILSTLQKQ